MPSSTSESESSDDGDTYGPKLPPPALVKGPTLPPNLTRQSSSSDDEDDSYGPQLPGTKNERDYSNTKVLLSKSTDDANSTLPKREEWMTVVPDKVEAKLGFKSVTSFSKNSSTEVSKQKPTTSLELPNNPPSIDDEVSATIKIFLASNH